MCGIRDLAIFLNLCSKVVDTACLRRFPREARYVLSLIHRSILREACVMSKTLLLFGLSGEQWRQVRILSVLPADYRRANLPRHWNLLSYPLKSVFGQWYDWSTSTTRYSLVLVESSVFSFTCYMDINAVLTPEQRKERDHLNHLTHVSTRR